MINIGNTKIGKLYLGSTELSKAYLGNTLIFQKGGGPTPPPGPIPAGAIACDFLYSDGRRSFIPTDFVPLPTMSYDTEIVFVLPANSFIIPFGYYLNYKRYTPIVLENRRYQVGYNGWYWGNSNLYPEVIRLRVKVVATPTGTSIEMYNLDGTLYDSQTVTYNEGSFTTEGAIGLLGRREGVSNIYDGSWRGGLAALKCYGDDHFGTLLAEFNPCYYQGNFGYWDTVSQQFYIGNTPGNIGGIGSYWDTEGFWPNTLNQYSPTSYPYLSNERDYITTREFAVPDGCTMVQYRVAAASLGGNSAILMCLTSAKEYRDWYSYNAVDRIITLPSNTAYIRMSIPKTYLSDAWLKDYTHNEYIWKGQNVI